MSNLSITEARLFILKPPHSSPIYMHPMAPQKNAGITSSTIQCVRTTLHVTTDVLCTHYFESSGSFPPDKWSSPNERSEADYQIRAGVQIMKEIFFLSMVVFMLFVCE